jgi:hypothetical protein
MQGTSFLVGNARASEAYVPFPIRRNGWTLYMMCRSVLTETRKVEGINADDWVAGVVNMCQMLMSYEDTDCHLLK